jgi:CubicO group peptidase (beta-lactamase class C family)
MSSRSFDGARRVLKGAIAARTFPAATVDVGSTAGTLWQDAVGTVTADPPLAAAIDTPFDLASLTKVLVTTTVVMQLMATGRLRLDDRVAAFFEDWRGADRVSVTVRDLLEHASGLPARLVDPPPASRREFEYEICRIALEYEPRTRSIYSDLGFILLGFIAEQRGGATLPQQFADVIVRLTAFAKASAVKKPDTAYELDPRHLVSGFSRTNPLTFELDTDLRRRAAPTLAMDDDARRGRTLTGEVHDNYAAALGGAAGHAGLFGTAPAIGHFARFVLAAARGDERLPAPLTPALVRAFTTKSSVPASSRALGWDTMLPSSSCGGRMSAAAFGHVGFTGTSLWIDPGRDRYFVLLTNRAAGSGTLDEMRSVRREFHDALGDI